MKTARSTFDHTSQLAVRSAIDPLTRRYHTDIMQLNYKQLNTRIYTDTMFSNTKSFTGNICSQIFTNGKGFIHSVPMKSKAGAGQALRQFLQDFGIPNYLTYDGSKEQCQAGTLFQRTVQKHRIDARTTEPETSNQNKAEAAIRECKRRWKQRIIRRRVPKRV